MKPYNRANIPHAKELRKNMTPWERKLWYDYLRYYPVRFQRQKAIGEYIDMVVQNSLPQSASLTAPSSEGALVRGTTEKTVYALGFFDGVHIGHQALLKACRELAESLGCKAGVITFASHPDKLVLGQAPKLLNTLQDRARLLQSYGDFQIVKLPFDEKMQKMPWQDFFCLLTNKYAAAGLVCGEDFRFGNRGEGTAELLKKACENAGIGCQIVREQTVDGIRVSSTYIRQLLESGEMEKATLFLGHPHILTGIVVEGQKLGRTIGIPTANLELPEQLVQPKFGVYACKTTIDGKPYLAVTNVGNRPTVDGQGITVEPWILDFEDDLYGKEITVEFHAFLRPEEKFENLDALQAQIHCDAEKTRIFFDKK